MDYIRLGSTGYPFRLNWNEGLAPVPGLYELRAADGSLQLDEAVSRPLIKQALELGINLFDTANAYSDGMSEVGLRYQMAASERLKVVLKLAADRADRGTPLPAGQGRGIVDCPGCN